MRPHYSGKGKCSTFGGPDDTGVGKKEGVALYNPGERDIYNLFLPGKVGWARGLNPQSYYCAMRWEYSTFPSRAAVRDTLVRVTNPRTGIHVVVRPSDWGPGVQTGRLIDCSPAALERIGAHTDDIVLAEVLVAPGQ
jgi:hypothetical protein